MIANRLALPLVLAATPALAHPGHAQGGLIAEFGHWFGEPDHLALMALLTLGIACLGARTLRMRARTIVARITRR
jgi:hydrogenase/urease accessory protein HupE